MRVAVASLTTYRYNNSDRDIDYGEIFGDDIADTPGLKIWVIEGWKVKAVDEEVIHTFFLSIRNLRMVLTDPKIFASSNARSSTHSHAGLV